MGHLLLTLAIPAAVLLAVALYFGIHAVNFRKARGRRTTKETIPHG